MPLYILEKSYHFAIGARGVPNIVSSLGWGGGIHTYTTTKTFKQCYIPLMPVHMCMQQIYLITVNYLTLLILK